MGNRTRDSRDMDKSRGESAEEKRFLRELGTFKKSLGPSKTYQRAYPHKCIPRITQGIFRGKYSRYLSQEFTHRLKLKHNHRY